MKKKAYLKNQVRIIKKTKARFLSIFCIVFLGAAFFAGLRQSPLIMKESIHDYLQTYQWNDLNYIATYGFDDSVIQKVKKLKEVAAVDYGFRFDALLSYDEKANIGMTVYSDDDFKTGVDLPELLKGRLPKKENECLIDYQYIKKSSLKLKDTITLESDYGKKDYKIVGIVNDSRYISNLERGTNSLGDGNNSGFVFVLTKGNENMAVPQELFDLHDNKTFYNDLRIHLKNGNDYYEFDDDYDDYVKPINKKIKTILKSYNTDLYEKTKTDALNEIADGEKKYQDGLKEYQEGMDAYTQGQKQYLDGKKQYEQGYLQYQQGLKQYQSGLTQYNQGYSQYQSGLKQYEEGLSQYQSGYETYLSYENQVKQYDDSLKAIEDQINQLGGIDVVKNIPSESPYYQQCQTLLQSYEALKQNETQINTLKAQLPSIQEELTKNKAVLDSTKVTLDQSKKRLEASKKKLDDSKALLDQTGIKLASSKKQLDQAKNELDTNYPKLEEAKVDLAKAKEDLDQAKEQVNDLKKGKVITLTKNESAAILSFSGNCDSINALSMIFPILFFLVAALVSMTTMTRMVEELRVQNGTFMALGYKKKDVIMQYLVYAFLATFFACSLGIVFGTYFFPSIIYYLYRIMMFDVGAPTRVIFEASTCIQTYLISVGIILLVTFMVCSKELKERPAQILRPKAPKLGKRILLERITFIWKRLSFNQKVTMRNIFRYKKRFLMSVIGIAGCTALIVIGFGIKYSVSPLASEQYGKMWIYDGVVNYQDDLTKTEEKNIQQDFINQKQVKSTMGIFNKTTTIDNQMVTIEIPSQPKEFDKYIHMSDIQSGKTLTLNDQGVYINAKLAELLDLKVGDSMTIPLDNKDYKVKVAGVYKLYFRHYIYMSPNYYKKLTGQDIDYNSQYFKLHQKANEKALTKYCDHQKEITSIQYVSGISEGFYSQMESLDSVVLILIVCAGALAFIVLYNLTNINIQERKSEIATIKVLGFYPKEVYDYVFRENIILSVIGSIVGLFLGKMIHGYLIRTVEVDMAMFIRSVNLKCYFIAFILTMVFTFLIDYYMRRVLKKIDMVESLKSIE